MQPRPMALAARSVCQDQVSSQLRGSSKIHSAKSEALPLPSTSPPFLAPQPPVRRDSPFEAYPVPRLHTVASVRFTLQSTPYCGRVQGNDFVTVTALRWWSITSQSWRASVVTHNRFSAGIHVRRDLISCLLKPRRALYDLAIACVRMNLQKLVWVRNTGSTNRISPCGN